MKKLLESYQEMFIKNGPHGRIRVLRRQKNLTIKQAAEMCATTEKAWSDWESGKVLPREMNQKRIARILGVDRTTIFEELKILYKLNDNVFEEGGRENLNGRNNFSKSKEKWN